MAVKSLKLYGMDGTQGPLDALLITQDRPGEIAMSRSRADSLVAGQDH